MTNPRAVIGALSDIEALLDRLSRTVNDSMRSAETYISGTQHAIDQCRTVLEHELYRARSAYAACRQSGYTDKDGRYIEPNCDREAAIVDAIEDQVSQLRYLANAFEGACRAHHANAARMRSLLGGTIPSANSFVRDRRQALEQFETSGALGAFASASGAALSGLASAARQAASHGYAYQKARQQYLGTLADDPNQPRHVRGWVQQELNRIETQRSARITGAQPPGGSMNRLRGVPGYDVGHRIPNIDLPANFRLEDPSVNRARPGIARRLGLSDRYR